MKTFLFVLSFIVASSAAQACNPGNTAFVYKGQSVVFDSSGKMVVQPTSLIGSRLVERDGVFFVITPKGAELELESYCVD